MAHQANQQNENSSFVLAPDSENLTSGGNVTRGNIADELSP